MATIRTAPGGGVALGWGRPACSRIGGYRGFMTALLIIVIILFALGILGTVVKGLLWLTLIAAVLLVATVVFGWVKVRAMRS